MKVTNVVTINLNEPKIFNKVNNDRFGKFVAMHWKAQIDAFTPRKDGFLLDTVQIRPFEIEYRMPYAHYIYQGKLMVDPITKQGAFYSPDYGFWSRPGVAKVATEKDLQYSKDLNPFATCQWDKAAEKAGKKEILYREINSALQGGFF